MSAPLVVNTRDGVCWTRRTVTSGGIALYAPESVKTCPRFVMATIEELAGHGIVGSADVLPVPPGPQRGVLDRARDAVDARMSKDALRHVLQNVIEYAAGLNARVAELEAEADRLSSIERTTLTELHRRIEHHMDGKARWRKRAEAAEARVAELEAAAKEIQRLHTDSPMGPCPVCIDGDAMVRGEDYTLPYPCPTARLAGAKDCDPPSYVSRPLPPRDAVCARPGCGHPGVEHHHGDTRCWARLPKPLGAPVTNCDCTGFVAETGGGA